MLCRLLLLQGVMWLTILGVAPFIVPRFFGRPSRHGFEESPVPPPGWTPQLLLNVSAGFLVLSSFLAEAFGLLSGGLAARAVIVLAYLAYAIPGLLRSSHSAALCWSIRAALLCSGVGWLLAARYPQFHLGSLHLSFLGCGLLILTIATRVVLGHADRIDRLQGRMRLFHFITGLTILTGATRTSADMIASIRASHLVYSALGWVLVLALWTYFMRRELKAPNNEASTQ